MYELLEFEEMEEKKMIPGERDGEGAAEGQFQRAEERLLTEVFLKKKEQMKATYRHSLSEGDLWHRLKKENLV